ncbi:hypothetical protein Y597_6057 [Burkholderia pseudomallei MSHR1000]|nr:hypothetical protein Y597_6057 [Burkholderia pseudomallei MSHR1000]
MKVFAQAQGGHEQLQPCGKHAVDFRECDARIRERLRYSERHCVDRRTAGRERRKTADAHANHRGRSPQIAIHDRGLKMTRGMPSVSSKSTCTGVPGARASAESVTMVDIMRKPSFSDTNATLYAAPCFGKIVVLAYTTPPPRLRRHCSAAAEPLGPTSRG